MSTLFLMILSATLTCAQSQPETTPQANPSGARQIAHSLLADAIQDRNPDVRKDAAEAMSLMKPDDNVFHDLESLLDDGDVLVRTAVVTTLGSFKDKKALPLLEKALDDPPPEVD